MKTKLLEKLAKENGYADVASMLMDYGAYPLARVEQLLQKESL